MDELEKLARELCAERGADPDGAVKLDDSAVTGSISLAKSSLKNWMFYLPEAMKQLGGPERVLNSKEWQH